MNKSKENIDYDMKNGVPIYTDYKVCEYMFKCEQTETVL